jgi:hypothetical protein
VASRQQTFNTDVLIEVRPFNGVSVAQQSPILSLHVRGIQQPGVPSQGHNNPATVGKFDREIIVAYRNRCCQRFDLKYQSTYVMPPGEPARASQQS